jgi:serine protease Do
LKFFAFPEVFINMNPMNMKSQNRGKKVIFIVAILFLAIFVIGSFSGVREAHANPLSNFVGDLLSPFNKQSSPAVPTSTPVSLYQPANDYENAVVAAVKGASPAVVSITISENVPIVEQCPYNPFQSVPPEFQQFFGNDFPNMTQQCDSGKTQLQAIGGGSGFIVSPDGLILTNKHVVSDASAHYTVLTSDGKTYVAKVLARDPAQDLAILKINETGLPTVTLGDSNGVQLGQTAIAIGNALGEFSNTVSVGVISGLSRTVTASGGADGSSETIHGVIQTDAAINPGNSGGPLLNLRGEVIAIDTAIATDAQNIGFAIPINQAKRDIASVESGGQIQAPYLGVRYISITSDLAKQQNLPVAEGALVRGSSDGAAVAPNSPAAKAGIQAEDIVIGVNGQAIDANHDLGTIINQHNVGDVISLTIDRGSKTITLQATLAARPAN